MTKTRNNHYVPQWYQEGFFDDGRNTLAYLDLQPRQHQVAGGRIVTERALFDAPTSRAFRQLDLYSTFFGTLVNDEIERHLFGDIDARGSKAVRAFAGSDVSEWTHHFQNFFEYIDIQKIRTPKGLDWLKAQYPALSQNDLMFEMQGIRAMHCTIWSEGVREIVSAEDADVKFLVSDHPVTIYNHALPPTEGPCAYPHDPSIALKASQTIFPLNRDLCLILTNLEYAKDPSTRPLDKRTFARNYRSSMVRTDTFIRSRKLSSREVQQINVILKGRARRFVAAGRKEWLYPEQAAPENWSNLRTTLLPPKNELWHFGGELYASFEDGSTHYQDAFGRREPEREFLKKSAADQPAKPSDVCGCGSGRAFKTCCQRKPIALRPSWTEASIRERNLLFYNGIVNVLQLQPDSDWVEVRRRLTDEQISKIYSIYDTLWPLETDLLALLPKPDGMPRAVYTGHIHPKSLCEFALGASLYFGELLIEHPFLHAGTVKKEFSPVENPRAFRHEFLKSVISLVTVMPLVGSGLVHLVPDPCNFDHHLRDQMHHMATVRSAGLDASLRTEPRMQKIMKEDIRRTFLSLPQDALRAKMQRKNPGMDEASLEEVLRYIEREKEADPLAVLQEASFGGEGGQLSLIKLAPNFEMALYLAQATGASIVTDCAHRWQELLRAIHHRGEDGHFDNWKQAVHRTTFAFPQHPADVALMHSRRACVAYPDLMRDGFRYLRTIAARGSRPNFEAHLAARFARVHAQAQAAIQHAEVAVNAGRISCVFPRGGIQDNSVNRLLLMSSSEQHLPSVPMAFFIEAPQATPLA